MEEFTDCTIIVDSIKFECHKVILSSYSDFFHAMFKQGTMLKNMERKKSEDRDKITL